nr:APH(3')-I family aminoglycoside O-phosphotransferase [uncultured Sphingomonas sp.]
MDTDREEACAAIPVPASMSSSLIGYEWARDNVGESGGAVYRLHSKAGAPDLFLKHGQSSIAGDIADEMVRLRWLASHVPVPAVERFVFNPDEAWLLMTAVPGQTAYQVLEAHPEARIGVVDALANFLRRLHAIPISACPFTSDHAYRLAQVRERIDAGLVDEDDFDDEREGWTSEQVWEAMQGLLPISSDPVVTHGDFLLDNILMLKGEVVGCIDTGKAGIADRYQDLAILWNNLGEFGASLQSRLLEQYGIAHADERKLLFHLLLDEMF